MNNISPLPSKTVVARVSALVPWMQQRAEQLDVSAGFPIEEIAVLQDAGALGVPLPSERVGSAGESPDLLNDVLMELGRGNLAIGRVVEAHINARHLIARYGSRAQRARASADVGDRHLYALWVHRSGRTGSAGNTHARSRSARRQ
jgi:hypothetical protein